MYESYKSVNEFLKGKKAFLLSHDELMVRMNVDKNYFRVIYEFLSSQMHSLPLSFYRMGNGDRGRGLKSETEENYTELCISLAADFLSRAQEEMGILFR